MKKLILHIGFGKTGSSYLQSCLARSSKSLLEEGVFYPDAPGNAAARAGKVSSGNGVRLAKYLNPNNALNVDVSNFWPEFSVALQKNSCPIVLYSSEFLANFAPDKMSEFKKSVAELGYEIHLICYVRSIAGHAYSNYSQRVKRHLYQESFAHYLRNDYWMPFRGLFKRITMEFATENYTLRNYDLVRNELWKDFRQQITTKSTEFESGACKQKIVNRSLSLFELDFMRTFNRYLTEPQQASKVSDALIYADREGRVEYVLTQDEAQYIQENFQPALDFMNRYMADEHKVDLYSQEFRFGDRQEHELDEFQVALLSVVASLFSR